MPVRIAVVGLAGIGRKHLSVLAELPGAELAAVCDVVPAVAEQVGAEQGVPAFTRLDALLDAGGVDAVSLATPPASHRELTALAAAAKVHVLAEKPMANTVENAQAMIDACRAAGVVLMVGHKKRYLPAVRRLKELLAGELGPILHLNHRYPHPWLSEKRWYWDEADGGGTQLENAIHAADLLRHLAGPPARIYAEGADHYAEQWGQLNDATYTIRFQSGAIGCVNNGMVSLPALNFEDVFLATEHGVAELSGGFDNADTLKYAFRGAAKAELHTETFTGDAFRLEFEDFLHCIATGAEPVANGPEGREAVRWCLAVKQSARTGRPVELTGVTA